MENYEPPSLPSSSRVHALAANDKSEFHAEKLAARERAVPLFLRVESRHLPASWREGGRHDD